MSCEESKISVDWALKSEIEKEEVHVGDNFVFLVRAYISGTTKDPDITMPDFPENIKRKGQTRFNSTNVKGDEKGRELYIRTVLVGVKPGEVTIPPVKGNLGGIVKQSKEHRIRILP